MISPELEPPDDVLTDHAEQVTSHPLEVLRVIPILLELMPVPPLSRPAYILVTSMSHRFGRFIPFAVYSADCRFDSGV